jgi:hypothetical protein
MTIEIKPSTNYPGRTALHHRTHPESNSTTIIDLTAEDVAELRRRTAPDSDRMFTAVALKAVEAWVIPGPVPAYHEARKLELRRDWPTLWHALEAMAQFDGITMYVPEAATPPPVEVDTTPANKAAAGLYALTRLSKTLPAGPARDLAKQVAKRPYAAALAAVLIAAQLGARSSWSGADELEQIGETLTFAGLPGLDEAALYRAIADQFGISHDDEDEEDGQ